jgi:hypothetical protein
VLGSHRSFPSGVPCQAAAGEPAPRRPRPGAWQPATAAAPTTGGLDALCAVVANGGFGSRVGQAHRFCLIAGTEYATRSSLNFESIMCKWENWFVQARNT